MWIYLLLFSMVLIGAFLDIVKISDRKKQYFMLIFMINCALISSIRWETGTDWWPYYIFFTENQSWNDFSTDPYKFEIGYALLNYMVKLLSSQYNSLLVVISVFIIVLKYKIIKSYAYFPLASLALNFVNCNGDLFPVRQSIAFAIVLFSTYFMVDRKFKLFLLSILFAALFHMSAIVFLPAYYIYGMQISRRNLLVCCMFFVTLGSTDFVKKGMEIFTHTFMGLDIELAIKMGNYLEEDVSNNISSKFVILLGFIRRCLFLPLLIYYKNVLVGVSRTYNGFLNLLVFGTCFFYFFSGLGVSLAGRGSFYYAIYEIFIIPYVLFWNKKVTVKILIFFIFLFYCIIKYFYGLYGFYELYIPYKSIF